MRGDRQLQVLRSRIAEEESTGTPGSILSAGDAIRVQCGRGSIDILELKPEGKKAMTAEEYLRGHRLETGEMLIP